LAQHGGGLVQVLYFRTGGGSGIHQLHKLHGQSHILPYGAGKGLEIEILFINDVEQLDIVYFKRRKRVLLGRRRDMHLVERPVEQIYGGMLNHIEDGLFLNVGGDNRSAGHFLL
jgi:hypothetical protein